MFTLCFTGHRQLHGQYYNGNVNSPGIWTDVYKTLYALCESAHTSCNVTRFIAGGAIGVDTLAAQVVLALKVKYPSIELIIARPFPSQACKWPKQSQSLSEAICRHATSIVDVSPDPYAPAKMQIRNQWMVDNSDYLLAVRDLTIIKGGTANAIQYATIKQKVVVGVLDINTLTTEWSIPE